MRFGLLGPVQVQRDDGTPVSIAAPKRRALLAVLLLRANHAVSTDDLVEALWGEEAPPAAISSLQAHVSRLRGELGQRVIETTPRGYLVRASDGQLDATQFAQLAREGSAALRDRRFAEAASLLAQALELWRGPALADVADEPFAAPSAMALEEDRLRALEDRIEADLRLGRHAELTGELRQLTGQHPFRERLWQQLMLALYRSGRQADALAAFRTLRSRLLDELGLDPSPELQELEARILRQDPAIAAVDASIAGPTVRLPVWLDRFVGRDDDLNALTQRVHDERLVTLVGPGGVGKTRLAIAAAQRLTDRFEDGAIFVDLSPIRDPALVLSTIGLEVGGGERPAEALLHRRVLLVLDNFEQILDAAPVVTDLLDRCPRIHVIVTSRAPLLVRGESRFDVLPLPTAEASDLFQLRSSEALERWRAERTTVEGIVSRLDGLPLAIELAAARTATLAPTLLRQALDRPLAVMTRGRRDAPERHRALRTTIGWSYDLLREPARRCLRALSVFAGGFELAAGLAVSEAELDALTDLVEHSLVQRDGTRYRLLETIREFATDEASATGELDGARDRHLAFFADLLTRRAGETGFAEVRRTWIDLRTRERDNVRVALDWAVQRSDDGRLRQLVAGMGAFWLIVGAVEEGERWGKAAVDRIPPAEPIELAYALSLLAEYPRWSGRHEAAISLRTQAIAGARTAGDDEIVATLLDDLASSLGAVGRLEEAQIALDEALRIRRNAPEDALGLSHTLSGMANLRLVEGSTNEALELVAQVRDADARAVLPAGWQTETDDLEARALLAVGRTNEAEALFRRVLTDSGRLDFRITMLNALIGLGAVAVERDPARAAILLGMADHVRAESGIEPLHRASYEALESRLCEVLGASLEEHRGAGRSLPIAAIPAAALRGV